MEQAESKLVTGLTGKAGAMAFIAEFFAAAEGAAISFGVGYGRNAKEYAIVASINNFTAGFSMEEARSMADTFEHAVATYPEAPEASCLQKMIVAFRDCADEVENLVSGVRQ